MYNMLANMRVAIPYIDEEIVKKIVTLWCINIMEHTWKHIEKN